MKKLKLILLTMLVAGISVSANVQNNDTLVNNDIVLPKPAKVIGMDVAKAIELRAATRSFEKKEIPLEQFSTILWAGYGIIKENGNKTVNGYDAISGATSEIRYSIPFGWEKPYSKIFVLLEKGIYEYLPKENKLKFLSDKNLKSDKSAYCQVVIAANYKEMPQGKNEVTTNVAYMTAGLIAQNMINASSAYGVKALPKVYFGKEKIRKSINLPENIELLTTIILGY